jgi:hypothetical protein
MITKPGDLRYPLSTRFGGRVGVRGKDGRMQFPNRTLLPKSPFFKGGL